MRLREAREARGLSQKYVALTLGVKPPNVSRWEAGVTYPTAENLIKLSRLYGMTIDYLLGLDVEHSATNYDESILVQVFRQLTPEARSVLLTTAQNMLQQPGMRKESTIVSAM